MKYLAYFKPNQRLSDLILKQEKLILPGSGLHATLCFFHMKTEYEQQLIQDLSQIQFDPFEIKTLRFDDFDKDSLVLRLSLTKELSQLHQDIVSTIKNYTHPLFELVIQKYFSIS